VPNRGAGGGSAATASGRPPERSGGSLTGRRAGAGGNPAAIRGAALGKSGVQRAAARTGYGTTAIVDLPSTRDSGGPDDRSDEQDVAVPSPDSAEGGRSRVTNNWKRALAVGVLCFVVWLILDAPTLMNNAEGSPLGTRRTIAMDFLRPISWISRETGLSHVVGAVDRILGRGGSGTVSISSGPPLGKISTSTLPPPTTIVTTKVKGHVTRHVEKVLLPDGLPPLPPISKVSPLRVLIIGDSVGTDLGQYALVDDLGSTNVVSATLDGVISTGLTRPDYFNWPAEMGVDLRKYHPELVIICIGANDPQSTIVNGHVLTYGTQAWDNMYSSRIGAFISEATSTGAHVLWVGMPPMAGSQLNAEMQHLDYLYQTQVSRHKGATYLSSVPSLGGRGGSYTAFKNGVEIRTDDGIHLQPAGAQLLSEAVISEMDLAYKLKLHP
jgi:lysophospholipase L1-like esterase